MLLKRHIKRIKTINEDDYNVFGAIVGLKVFCAEFTRDECVTICVCTSDACVRCTPVVHCGGVYAICVCAVHACCTLRWRVRHMRVCGARMLYTAVVW